MKVRLLLLASLLLTAAAASAQQVADLDYNPTIPRPAYEHGKGPVVAIDEARKNFHTAAGRYRPFAELLRRDGYRVVAFDQPISAASLRDIDVLVISNPVGDESLTMFESREATFSEEEAAALHQWVSQGGALMLVLDHKPFPGAGVRLTRAFGLEWHDGYALLETPQGRAGIITFDREQDLLLPHAITDGRGADERVDSVVSFTGSAFRAPPEAEALMVLPPGTFSLTPERQGQEAAEMPRTDVAGWLQGAVMKIGKGRAAFFGEAAMFSAQLAGPDKRPMGMNDPTAAGNHKFLLNVMRWLTGALQ
jgi:hypothetical protein